MIPSLRVWLLIKIGVRLVIVADDLERAGERMIDRANRLDPALSDDTDRYGFWRSLWRTLWWAL